MAPNSFASYKGTRVLVLGASGFIGRWVARALCNRDASVFLGVRSLKEAEKVFLDYQIHGQILEFDLCDLDEVHRLCNFVSPAITFNLVGYGVDPSEREETLSFEVNARAPETLCRAIAAAHDRTWKGQQLVHVGTALEYGTIGGDLSEDSIPEPTTLYGRSKLAGTQNVTRCTTECDLRALTARLFTVYGPGEHSGRLLPSLWKTARCRSPLNLTAGQQQRDFTYVGDVAEGVLRLGLTYVSDFSVVNLATGALTPVRDFVETAARIWGIPNELLRFGVLPTRSEEMEHRPVAVERLKLLTGWIPPTNVAEGIKTTGEMLAEVTTDRN